jgi:cytochrome P450
LYHLQGDLFGAGLDTTLTNLKWILLCLAKHQDVQDKVDEEVRSKCGDSNQGLRLTDIENLPYTQVRVKTE